MKTLLRLLATGLLFSGCGGYCWARCPEMKEQLVRDFAVLPQAIDRNSELWMKPKDCAECDAMLQKMYGVQMTACTESPYLEPKR
jgi:hypothetical protein